MQHLLVVVQVHPEDSYQVVADLVGMENTVVDLMKRNKNKMFIVKMFYF